MSIFNSQRLDELHEGKRALKEIMERRDKVKIIHYSCESFFVTHGRSPRITAICVRNLDNAQTKSFSIHTEAQIANLDFNNLSMPEYDTLEKKMLNKFNTYIRNNRDNKWVHWNMRDSNYGFEAISIRYHMLRGNLFEIPEDKRYDLARILPQIYTLEYEVHGLKGRFLNLVHRNDITDQYALTGAEEAAAFENKEFLKLQMSTLRKVDMMETILERAYNNELKVNVSKIKIYGLNFLGIMEIVRNSILLTIIQSIFFFILGAILEPYVQDKWKQLMESLSSPISK